MKLRQVFRSLGSYLGCLPGFSFLVHQKARIKCLIWPYCNLSKMYESLKPGKIFLILCLNGKKKTLTFWKRLYNSGLGNCVKTSLEKPRQYKDSHIRLIITSLAYDSCHIFPLKIWILSIRIKGKGKTTAEACKSCILPC